MKTATKLLCILGLISPNLLPAQSVPEYVNYQGLLKAADGSPLATGNYTIEFNIYDQANLGAKVWGPFLFDGVPGVGHGLEVPVVNGSFNVIIGPTDTSGHSIADAFAAPNRFIEIAVDGGDPILPRQQFLSTAYALQSQAAQLAQLAQMAVQASNLVQEAADALCPPGTIVAFGGTNDHPAGWLLCDGSAVASTNYPRLYAAITNAWGNGTHHQGTVETPGNPGTDFNLPDLRGMFLRGVNHGRTTALFDPNSTNRPPLYGAGDGNSGDNVGSVQWDDTDKRHKHVMHNEPGIVSPGGPWYLSDDNTYLGGSGTPRFGLKGGSPDEDLKTGQAISTRSTTMDETRPKNAYVHYIIKY